MKQLAFKPLFINKVIALLFHPLMLAFLFILDFNSSSPYHFPKYKAEIVNQSINSQQEVMFWDNLENDRISDRIFAYR